MRRVLVERTTIGNSIISLGKVGFFSSQVASKSRTRRLSKGWGCWGDEVGSDIVVCMWVWEQCVECLRSDISSKE